MKITILRLLAVSCLLILLASPSSSAEGIAYGGKISDDHINEGDKLRFTASLMNNDTIPYYIRTMNVTFVERLGNTAIRDPHTFNASKRYDTFRGEVQAGSTFTDTLVKTIDAEPGRYRVSIFFMYLNSSNEALLPWTGYSLANQTVTIEGQTQALQLARIIGIIILVAAIGLLVAYVYYRFKN